MAKEIEFTTIDKPQIVLERSDGTNLRLALTDYALLLREAKSKGWEPEGFVKVSRSGSYAINSDLEADYLFPQMGWVSDHDAKNLANALRKMVTQTEKFMNREVFNVEFYHFDEICDYDFDDFLESCSTASEVILSMGGFFVIGPQNFSEYLINEKNRVLMDFIEFCDLGEFHFWQVINEWFETPKPN